MSSEATTPLAGSTPVAGGISLDAIRDFAGVRAETDAEAADHVISAFKSVFVKGDATHNQRLLVLAELARKSGYFEICEELGHGELATHNARRAMFAHLILLTFARQA